MEFNVDIVEKEENKNPTQQHNNDWIKDLELQSWQAELVISGLIITILFQLPGLFISWVEATMIQSGELEYLFVNFASLIFLVGIDLLIIFFGIHLLLRGIWISLLGLNSVYPNGIDVKSKIGMGEKYWQKTKEKYPNLFDYNLSLDADCSLLFSFATVAIIMVSSIAIFILALYKITQFLTSLFPILAENAVYIGIGLYLFFTTIAFVTLYLGKKHSDNKHVEKWIMGYSAVTEVVYSLYIFRKPVGYILSIVYSNSKSQNLLLGMFLSGLLGFIAATQMGESNTIYHFRIKEYLIFNNRPNQTLPLNYENLLDKNATVYTPFIQSDIVTDDFLKIFIPTIEREMEHIDFKENSILERIKMNDQERENYKIAWFEALKNFNRIFINGVECSDKAEYQSYTHQQATEKGLLVYVSSDNFVEGKNVLEIKKNYTSKDGIQKIVKIPFYFKQERKK
jgi:hypothetical protein